MNSILVGRWHIGIGDPSLIGWVTVAFYAAVFVFCLAVIQREQPNVARKFWFCISLLVFGLGINKQLDLQTWLTEFGRDMAMLHGWYSYRRMVQFGFIAGLMVLGLLCALGMARWARLADQYAVRAAIGLAILLVFVLMRATSFHHLDRLLGIELATNVTFNAAFELVGVCVIGWAACGRLWDVGPKRR